MATAVEEIAVGKLVLADDNLRSEVDEALAESIKTQGVLEPLLVREDDLLVVAGARRLAGAKKAGLKTVPVIRRPFSEAERVQVMIVENLQRTDLLPMEEAAGFARLVELGLTPKEIGAQVGCSATHVQTRIALLELPQSVQQKVDKGEVTLSDAKELARVKDDPKLVESITKKAGGNGGYGRSISSQVVSELSRRTREKELAAATRKLRKAGEPVVEITPGDEYGYGATLPAGHARVLAETYSTADVQMDPKKHAKLDCHAVAVNPRTMGTIEVCTNPDSHPSRADELAEEQAERQREAKKKRDRFDRMQAKRRTFVREEIAGRVDKEALLELVLYALVTESSYWGDSRAEDDLACELLGVELADERMDEAESSDLAYEALNEAIEKDRLRATFAIAAARIEATLGDHGGQGSWSDAADYFGWLEKRGYKLSAEEKKRVKRPEPRTLEQQIDADLDGTNDAGDEEAAE